MDELKKLNLRRQADSLLDISPDSIPTLIPVAALSEFQAGDNAPYYKIQSIDYPTQANGYTYTESFWQSYIGKLNRAPIPGSARGHETRWGARGPTDLILIGALIKSNGDGSGTVFLKNYIPPQGESGDNSVFIKMNKAGMVDYSIVAYTKDEMESLPDGTRKWYCIESIGGERNDAVDYGAGAMEMKTNAEGQKVNSKGLAFARSLIAAGKLDNSSAWKMTSSDENALLGTNGDDWSNYAKWHLVEDMSATEDTKARWRYPFGKNGKVYRSALRAIASRASAQGLEDVSNAASELITEIDKKKKKGNYMEKDDVLAWLKTAKQNSAVSLVEIAEAIGLKDQLKSDDDKAAIAKLNSIKTLVGAGDPEEFVQNAKEEIKKNSDAAREVAITKAFGVKSNKVGDKELVNPAHQYAAKMCANLSGAELDTAIKELADDAVMVNIRKGMADENSSFNIIEEHSDKKHNAESTIRVMDY